LLRLRAIGQVTLALGAAVVASALCSACRTQPGDVGGDGRSRRQPAPLAADVPDIWRQAFGHFVIDCPAPWRLVTAAPDNVLWMCRDEQAATRWFGENCNVTGEVISFGSEPSAAEYAEAVFASAAAAVPTEEDSKRVQMQIGGRDAVRFWLRFPMLERPLTAMVTAFVSPGRGWAVTCTAERDSFEEYEARFIALTETFEVIGAPPFDLPEGMGEPAPQLGDAEFLVRVFYPRLLRPTRAATRDRWYSAPASTESGG
jgi:hypothetical protein